MAESVVFCVIQAVGELLLYEARYLDCIRTQLEEIQTKLRRLQAISKIADARQEEDERIRDWVAETREAAYIAEDILDIFAIEISLGKEKSLLQKYAGMWKECTSLHHLGPNIHQIEAKISYLESDWRVSNIKPIGQGDVLDYVSERRQQIRRTYSHHEEDFIELDDDVEKLVAHLVNEVVDRCYHVVSIIGMGGIGKTAVTRKIYHHIKVRSHFHAFAWVCISRKWRAEEILKRILNKLVPEKREQINGMNDISELIKELFEVQKMKKCLVVLDDVWETDVWKSLRPAFPNRKLGSKVLLTTRNKEIALHIDTDTKCYSYEQRHLNEDESWELLKKKAFPGIHMEVEDEIASGDEYEDARSSMDSFHSCLSDEETDKILGNVNTPRSECDIQDIRVQEDTEKIGKQMVGLCGGLPLAIIVLGGLLMTKSTLNEWKKVHQNFNSHLRKGRSLQENGIVYDVLALSYHDLPYQVKPCFLHLGNFPEDYEIPTRKLFQLWAAEGFILSDCHPSEEQESIMDIGERYLRKEENFLLRIPLSDEPKLIGSSSSSSNSTSTSLIHRLAISVDSDLGKYFPPESENLDHVRSAVFFSRLSNRKHLQSTLELLCNSFKLLRWPMATLEKLPNLYSLILRKNSFVGSVMHCSARGFDQLRTLEFQGLSILEDWIVEEGSMPNLLRLTIDECISLRMVPEGIKFISTMREMLIVNMPEAFKERVRLVEECGNNFYKITVRETNRDHITDFENPQDARQHEDDSIRHWVSKTREFVYDIEDLLEKFAIDISLRKERSVLRKPSEKNLTTLQDIESKISSRESDWEVCNIGSIGQEEILNFVSQRRQEIRRSYSHYEEDFVGLDEDVEELVARVVNEDGGDCCHVVSIIGIGGIGDSSGKKGLPSWRYTWSF
ncbi:hypothetical protein RD792_014110 [Penstemon davidsonii]|uniref:Uncharacterized protein n=1 Tax=Penstemon davidsonii TaxID=160366 RepID=A0ABR0CNF1_9LAMI|nr:hypothetical protein RD792_014110 [Penstemon davidsonii]